MASLLTTAQANQARQAIRNVFDTFARPFTVYVEPQQVTISTSAEWSRFGQHDQNVSAPAVTPQAYTITGCINYNNQQPYYYLSPTNVGDVDQNKIRESDGKVQIKVDATGYALLVGASRIVLDGVPFEFASSPRPHGIVGQPDRWTFTINRLN